MRACQIREAFITVAQSEVIRGHQKKSVFLTASEGRGAARLRHREQPEAHVPAPVPKDLWGHGEGAVVSTCMLMGVVVSMCMLGAPLSRAARRGEHVHADGLHCRGQRVPCAATRRPCCSPPPPPPCSGRARRRRERRRPKRARPCPIWAGPSAPWWAPLRLRQPHQT